ncbi:CaiB/BaiF CoA transferase family protein [Auritidibacter ignavus]|uniref:CaiB/BaiF CoA transferase family protein n=1 Tax=Auritidibacter ignavus TaxID=678932 RepID=UPI00109D5082|nr:CoA transferase [Auritidibacter ignavus]
MELENVSEFPPLAGVRVLDLSRVLAGPFAAAILADLGADVIKVESPWGDDSRFFGPFVNEQSAYYRLVNRSKRGITLNLKEEDEKQKLLSLVEQSDVVIENFRPGVLDKLGIPAAVMLEKNPRIIVTSISGFGQAGSMSQEPAYDLVAQAMSGLMSVTGWDGKATRVGVSLGDLIPALYAVIATQAALRQREYSGRGQHVDLAMYDSLVSMLESVGMRQLHTDEVITSVGNDHAMTVPFSTYKTADEEIVIAVSNDRLFVQLAKALDIENALNDDRFATYQARYEHRDETRELLERALAPYTAVEATEKLRKFGVPTTTIYSVEEALTGGIAEERQVVAIEDDGFQTLASPLHLPGMVSPRRAPGLGEHNVLIDQLLSNPSSGSGEQQRATSKVLGQEGTK